MKYGILYLNVQASDDKYIVGTMNNWTISNKYKMTETVEGTEWTFDFGTIDLANQRFMIRSYIETGYLYIGACSPVPSLTEDNVHLQYNGCSIQLAEEYSSATNIKMTLRLNGDVVSATFSGDYVKREGYEPDKSDAVSSSEPSGTLPVLHITTDKAKSFVDGDIHHDSIATGTLYIEGDDSQSEITKDSLKIQGRGNYTWQSFDKKPYKLKFDKKVSPFGMPANKNFALMACADDVYSYLRNTVGYEISRRMGMTWTPNQQPVEVIWNDEYIGLYILTENIKEGKGRVNITEQNDNVTAVSTESPTDITGGWIVEIDNNTDTPQLVIDDAGNPWPLRITGSYPSSWSTEQEAYIKDQWQNIYNAVSTSDWETTAKYIDIDAAARFYIIQEVTDNREAYNGSCYLYKDRDSTSVQSKWIFGPAWDFGCTFCSLDDGIQKYIYDNYAFNAHIINYLHNNPDFMENVKSQWRIFKGNNYEGLDTFIHNFIINIAQATKSDGAKWPLYDHSNVTAAEDAYLTKLHQRIDWLTQEWGEGIPTGIENVKIQEPFKNVDCYNLLGQKISASSKGIIITGGKKYIMR